MSTFFGIVYKITCVDTGKSYIGVTTGSITRRWHQHQCAAFNNSCSSIIGKAIRKYGQERFFVNTIACASSVEDLYAIEIALIAQENTITPYGYNIMAGGEGFCGVTLEVIQRNAQSRKNNPRVIAAHTGKQHTLETKQKIGRSNKGRIKSADEIQKLRIALSGRVFTPEHCKNIGLSRLGCSSPNLYEVNKARVGTKASDTHRQNIAEGVRRSWVERRLKSTQRRSSDGRFTRTGRSVGGD